MLPHDGDNMPKWPVDMVSRRDRVRRLTLRTTMLPHEGGNIPTWACGQATLVLGQISLRKKLLAGGLEATISDGE